MSNFWVQRKPRILSIKCLNLDFKKSKSWVKSYNPVFFVCRFPMGSWRCKSKWKDSPVIVLCFGSFLLVDVILERELSCPLPLLFSLTHDKQAEGNKCCLQPSLTKYEKGSGHFREELILLKFKLQFSSRLYIDVVSFVCFLVINQHFSNLCTM